jgi:hypothetical protein
METVEACAVRNACDSRNLRCEGVLGRRRVGEVDLEFLGSSVDLRPQFRKSASYAGAAGMTPPGRRTTCKG